MEAIVKDEKTIVLSEEAARRLRLRPGERLRVKMEGDRIVLETVSVEEAVRRLENWWRRRRISVKARIGELRGASFEDEIDEAWGLY